MIPLFDMMMQAQNGNAMDVMAKQFGLAQEQMAKATARPDAGLFHRPQAQYRQPL